MVFEIISNINLDCNFISSINESSFIEKITKPIKEYYNFLFCILDNCDLILSNSDEKEKNILFKKRVLYYSSQIDENEDNYYNNMNYNPKKMKKKIIQLGLHSSMDKKLNISSLYYMNDLYKTHFVFVDLNKREYYDTTVMNYDKMYLCLNKNKYTLSDNIPNDLIKKDINDSIFCIDVKDIYKTYLESISKYKISDLKEIALKLDIPLKENNKNKTKNILYNEINKIKMINN